MDRTSSVAVEPMARAKDPRIDFMCVPSRCVLDKSGEGRRRPPRWAWSSSWIPGNRIRWGRIFARFADQGTLEFSAFGFERSSVTGGVSERGLRGLVFPVRVFIHAGDLCFQRPRVGFGLRQQLHRILIDGELAEQERVGAMVVAVTRQAIFENLQRNAAVLTENAEHFGLGKSVHLDVGLVGSQCKIRLRIE